MDSRGPNYRTLDTCANCRFSALVDAGTDDIPELFCTIREPVHRIPTKIPPQEARLLTGKEAMNLWNEYSDWSLRAIVSYDSICDSWEGTNGPT